MTAPRALALCSCAVLSACAGPKASFTSPAAHPAQETGLRALADARGLLLGAAVMPGQLRDRQFAETLVRNLNYLTPENSMKWPTRSRWRSRWTARPRR